MRLTIFTPTYNRANTLTRLYQSLEDQTKKDFEWIIVDDGSTDNTEILIQSFIKNASISIKYYKQINQGKPSAHNKGVELTQSELFVCVDSDDYLVTNAVEEVISCWDKYNTGSETGIIIRKITTDNKSVTHFIKPTGTKTTLKNAYDSLGLSGDAMLVFKSEIIKKYAFPKFEGEKFIPEGYLYDLIDQDGKLIFLDKELYYCEYLDGGYTSGMARLLFNNPQGYFAYIDQRIRIDKTIKHLYFDTGRRTAMCLAHNLSFIKDAQHKFIAFISFPVGLILYLKKYKRYKVKK